MLLSNQITELLKVKYLMWVDHSQKQQTDPVILSGCGQAGLVMYKVLLNCK